MINIKDIYYNVGSSLLEKGFWEKDIEEKKELIDEELKNYIIEKIQTFGVSELIVNKEQELNVTELLQILASYIPLEEQFETLRHFTHYILQVAGDLQGYYITWWSESDAKLKENSIIEFDENGLWSDLKTHDETDYVKTFIFVYDVFVNKFLKKETPKKLVVCRDLESI